MQLNDYRDDLKIGSVKILGVGILLIVISFISPRLDHRLIVANSSYPLDEKEQIVHQLDRTVGYIGLVADAKKPNIHAKQFVLLDGQTAEIIIGEDPDLVAPIASTTKMTTALVALANLELDKIVTIGARPPLIQGSKIGLKKGERITIRSLIQGLLIYSGNDAAFALAEAYSDKPGDYQQFVSAMNDFAGQNNLSSTVYGDPAGLDDQIGRSTPRELANVARLLLKKPFLAQTVATAEMTISSADGQISHQLKNTNRLIIPNSPYYLPQTRGVKTGFTLDAGHSLVAAYRWRDRDLIGVILNTTESTNIASAVEMNKLFRWADQSLEINNY